MRVKLGDLNPELEIARDLARTVVVRNPKGIEGLVLKKFRKVFISGFEKPLRFNHREYAPVEQRRFLVDTSVWIEFIKGEGWIVYKD